MSKINKSTSMFIGYTTRGIAQPVLFDTHTQIYNNKPPMTLITGSPGSGKDLDIETPIPTPYGFTKMKDLRTGDKVLGRNSKPCRVTYVGEIKKRSVYRVVLSDKRELIAGEKHQWSITTENTENFNDKAKNAIRNKKSDIIREQVDIITRIQKNAGVKFSQKEWLTVEKIYDSLATSGVSFWADSDDLEETLIRYNIIYRKNNKELLYSVLMAIQALKEELVEQSILARYKEKVVTTKEMKSLLNKNSVKIRTHIPNNGDDDHYNSHNDDLGVSVDTEDISTIIPVDKYSFGNITERRKELNKIISDYFEISVDQGNLVNVVTDSVGKRDKLERVMFLVHSLGGIAFLNKKKDVLTFEKNVLDDHCENVNNWVHVVGIEKIEDRETRCISVDSEDHVYLAGTGFIPTHNTFFAMTLTCLSAILGKTTVVLDPKGDFLSLSELTNDLGDISFWALKDPKKAGILDPFYMADNEGEKLQLVLNTLSLFLGKLSPKQLQILSPHVRDVIKSDLPSLMSLMENLRMSANEDARGIGVQLEIISRLPFANLCFAPGLRRQKEISIDEGITVITMAGLELKQNDGEDTNDIKARLSSAVFFLITDFIRRFMYNSSDLVSKTIIIDEAWAVLATPEGAKVVQEIALLARSKNLAIVLITQNTEHIKNINAKNTIASRFAFRTDSDQGEILVKDMGLPINENFESILTSLEAGECLMQDWQGRYSTVQISQYNSRWKEAFETNPMEKRRKARLKEAKGNNRRANHNRVRR